MSDFTIDESILNQTDTDVIDDKMMEATQRLAEERERLLALAFYKGYDGVDIHTKDRIVTDVNQHKMGFEYEVWEGEPPTLDRFGQKVRRYDFRGLTREEKRIVLSKVGVQLEEWEE